MLKIFKRQLSTLQKTDKLFISSGLYVPGNQDSVPIPEKPKARVMIRDRLQTMRENAFSEKVVITPRTNSIQTGMFEDDVSTVLNENTSKLINGIVAAAFGADDFTADFQVYRSDSDKELDFARKLFALTCHAFGIISIDTPYVQFKNLEGLKVELEYLKSIGMKAKFAIHPTQVELINKAFSPSEQEVVYYQRMIQAFEEGQKLGKAAIDFENKMVDIAAYRRAVDTLKRAGISAAAVIPNNQFPVHQFQQDLWHPSLQKKYIDDQGFIIVNHERPGLDTYVELINQAGEQYEEDKILELNKIQKFQQQPQTSLKIEGLNCNSIIVTNSKSSVVTVITNELTLLIPYCLANYSETQQNYIQDANGLQYVLVPVQLQQDNQEEKNQQPQTVQQQQMLPIQQQQQYQNIQQTYLNTNQQLGNQYQQISTNINANTQQQQQPQYYQQPQQVQYQNQYIHQEIEPTDNGGISIQQHNVGQQIQYQQLQDNIQDLQNLNTQQNQNVQAAQYQQQPDQIQQQQQLLPQYQIVQQQQVPVQGGRVKWIKPGSKWKSKTINQALKVNKYLQSFVDLMQQYRDIIYKTSSQEVGKTAHLAEKKTPFGHNGKFSKHLSQSGMPKNNGLSTATDRERFMDNCKDWMDKIN
ncbi:citrate lyase subunit beta [Stylonychia lemnae]|uniref:Citrate lyase subunit beta n=1 Tax=Stylonychia lemnae TaxID=5949 RepID=A0A077ZX65_STYLE|nr:citrate lyase subunit beta [Stylonychia lemnae]|eukprot:CDW74511.1 citrate lyase subunit beta [Stylonychia lemnae]